LDNYKEYEEVVKSGEPIITIGDNLNLGCGYSKMRGFINVDKYDVCKPDVVCNMDEYPWPWPDNSIDHIFASHIFEHLEDWWAGIKECARILKPGGTVHIRIPDESESSAGTYRDHLHIISIYSFYGLQDRDNCAFSWVRNVNAWAAMEYGTIPLVITEYCQVPHVPYQWMVKWCPWLMQFCATHMRNFIHEQRITLERVGDENGRN